MFGLHLNALDSIRLAGSEGDAGASPADGSKKTSGSARCWYQVQRGGSPLAQGERARRGRTWARLKTARWHDSEVGQTRLT